MLKVKGLKVEVEGKEILKGMDLVVKPGEVVGIMGPNGSGKSTLGYSLAGHSRYRVSGGEMTLDGKDLLKMRVDERAELGLFLGWQSPVTVKGVTVEQMLRAVILHCREEVCKKGDKCMTVSQFRKMLVEEAKRLKIDKRFLWRSINEGFSGGEKKKMEILQMTVLKPRYAVLDETDSGLDIDALKIVAKGINRLRKENPKMGIGLITHYQRILNYVRPDRVLVMKEGRIVKSGRKELVRRVEKEGYEGFK